MHFARGAERRGGDGSVERNTSDLVVYSHQGMKAHFVCITTKVTRFYYLVSINDGIINHGMAMHKDLTTNYRNMLVWALPSSTLHRRRNRAGRLVS